MKVIIYIEGDETVTSLKYNFYVYKKLEKGLQV